MKNVMSVIIKLESILLQKQIRVVIKIVEELWIQRKSFVCPIVVKITL